MSNIKIQKVKDRIEECKNDNISIDIMFAFESLFKREISCNEFAKYVDKFKKHSAKLFQIHNTLESYMNNPNFITEEINEIDEIWDNFLEYYTAETIFSTAFYKVMSERLINEI